MWLNRIFLSALLFISTIAQAQFNDDFNDGNFTSSPAWSGDNAQFIINATNQLQTAATVAGSSYLSSPNLLTSLDNMEWQVYVKQSFSPSAQNFSRVYLVSNQADLEASLNGYFLQFGENGSLDAVELFRQDGTTLTSIARGTDAQIAVSFAVRVKVTRDNAGTWNLFVDGTGGTSFALQATGTDNTYTTSDYIGLATTYTISNISKFYFDDFYAGPIITDTTPPSVQSVQVINSSSLDVSFNEPVELSSAQTITNYLVNNSIGNPSSATRDASDPSLVHLTFTNAFSSGVSNTLDVNNVQDVSSNTMTLQSVTFTYVAPVVAFYKDVVINEFMADPDPSVGLPQAEYIELFNNSNKTFNLNGWKISDPTTTGTIQNAILLPGAYMLLVKSSDTALFSSTPNKVVVTNFPSLNNSGDQLNLKDNNSILIDNIEYDLTWYRDALKDDGGWSLELINPTISCGGANNWSASSASQGGTPGIINAVFNNAPDTTKPTLVKATAITQNNVLLQLSENADSTSIANATYTINNGIVTGVVQGVSPSFNQVLLSVTPLDSSTVYNITVSGISDCSGNSMNSSVYSFGLGKSPLRFELVINEIMANPASSPSLPEIEFIELYNASQKVIRLEGMKISDASTTGSIETSVLLPGEHLIICSTSGVQSFSGYGKAAGVTNWPSLNSTSDTMRLKDAFGKTIHQVNYSDSWYGDDSKKNGGWSLEMIDPKNPCGESNNWSASNNASGGTPGQINSIYASNPDVTVPFIKQVFPLDSLTLLVTFNEIIDSTSLVNATYTITNGIQIISAVYKDQKNFVLKLNTPLQVGIAYSLSAAGCTDCVGNTSIHTSFEFQLPEKAVASDIIINEILFNPRTGGSDFIEIYNRTSKHINLATLSIANSENGITANYKTIVSGQNIIKPSEFRVLSKDSSNIKNEYPNAVSGTFIQLASLPTFNDDEGTIVLTTTDSIVIDQVYYNDNMHFPLIKNTEGVTLERIDYNRPSNDSTNWHSAATSAGFATPGFENSQYLTVAGSGDDNIEIDPGIFSPDNDGYQDVLNIKYSMPSGFAANITIYDQHGRLIKRLAKNELLATSGIISWDGTNEDNEKAMMGIYVVLFEAFNTSGDIVKARKTCVLAVKL